MQKRAAERAVGRVAGVRAVAEELEVRLPLESKVADDEIAKRGLQSLAWDVILPASAVMVKVEKGWVTLTGDVDWKYQHDAAASDIRKLHGVVGVTNGIKVKPRDTAFDVRQMIKAAFDRSAQIETENIGITTDAGKVTLTGKVNSWNERSLAERTAYSAPGTIWVDDRLTVI